MMNRRAFLASTSALALAGCDGRGQFSAPKPGIAMEPVHVITASNRPTLDTTDRDTLLRFADLTIGVTTNRMPGDVPREGDGAFALLEQRVLPGDDELRQALGPVGMAPLVIFVHGFNATAAEAVHRQAQFAYDADLRGPQISFIWPSAETPGGYLYDRDSALQSRTALEDFLTLLPRIWSGETVVMAHSLGCLLVMEALVRMRLKGRAQRLEGLILMQPDIAPSVFAAQVRDIGDLPDNATLVINQEDPALRISALFSRSEERVGMTEDPQDYRELGFRVIDLTGQADAIKPHLAALSSPTVLDRIREIANR